MIGRPNGDGGAVRFAGAIAVLFGLALLLGACGPEDAGDRDRGVDDDRMRPGMMMRMMETMPAGIRASALPDPDSRGARLVARYCSQCHGIPTPQRLSAAEWPATLERMSARMEHMERMGGRMDVESPTAEEREQMLAYLQAHALRTVSETDLPDGGPDAALFARTCSRCHALPDPAQHHPEEWPSVVFRMRENMQRMDVEVITDEEVQAIIRYLQRAAATENGAASPHS